MKCLITDAVYEGIAESLKEYLDVTETGGKSLSYEALLEQIGDYDILIMRVNPIIDREILDAASKLKMIRVCAAGLNSNAAAELTFGMMLDIARKIIPANKDVKENHHWDRSLFIGSELRNKTPGIMGFGLVGRLIAELGKSFGMFMPRMIRILSPNSLNQPVQKQCPLMKF